MVRNLRLGIGDKLAWRTIWRAMDHKFNNFVAVNDKGMFSGSEVIWGAKSIGYDIEESGEIWRQVRNVVDFPLSVSTSARTTVDIIIIQAHHKSSIFNFRLEININRAVGWGTPSWCAWVLKRCKLVLLQKIVWILVGLSRRIGIGRANVMKNAVDVASIH